MNKTKHHFFLAQVAPKNFSLSYIQVTTISFLSLIERAKALAHAVSGEALPYEYLDRFSPQNKMVLANASSVGMEPNANESPITKVLCLAYIPSYNHSICISKMHDFICFLV